MEMSLNEIQTLAMKAARGMGLPWGLAEDAGNATKWLDMRMLDGANSLCKVLKSFENASYADLMPQIEDRNWKARRKVSALLAGISIADRPSIIAPAGIKIEALECPVFMLPFLSHASRVIGKNVYIKANGFEACLNDGEVSYKGFCEDVADTEILIAVRQLDHITRTKMRVSINQETLELLNGWAHRIYAPATEASRQKGAGAGAASDNE